MCVRYAETSGVPPPSEEETQQSHLSGTSAVRTRCRVIRVDTVRRAARRSCQRCSCSHSHKLTIRSNMKRKENRAGQKTNGEASHVLDGENSPTQTQRLLLLFCPNSCTVSSLALVFLSQEAPRPRKPGLWRLSAACWTTSTGTTCRSCCATLSSTSRWTNTPRWFRSPRSSTSSRLERPLCSDTQKSSCWSDMLKCYTPGFFLVCFFHVQLSVGADPQKTKRNFRGCLENLLYNGLNMLESAKSDSGNQVTLVVSIYEREN